MRYGVGSLWLAEYLPHDADSNQNHYGRWEKTLPTLLVCSYFAIARLPNIQYDSSGNDGCA
jgi:hypothetical protein